MIVAPHPDSPDLKLVKSLLNKEGIPEENIIEFLIKEKELDKIKERIRKKYKNNCYFFYKKIESNKVQLIALVNIKGIADKIEALIKNELVNIKYKVDKSKFSPTSVIFGK
ncbi:MAG: hypothetical protein KatS3mg068_2222 [Candidatus Sericytochromatia bacterium]|nr:MAG: hypothetical protein KatS3mg068_2222 [Candidatus Sericytochromatia bacterium]